MNPVETVEGLPGGVTRLFDRIELGGEAIAAAATAPGQTEAEKASAIAQRVGRITAWLSGQTSPRARKELGGRGWTALGSFTIAAER